MAFAVQAGADTKTIPQGITAVINYVSELSVEENEATMMEEIRNVKTGQVTYAVRDTMIDDKEIHQGDFMGIGDKGILSAFTSRKNHVIAFLRFIVQLYNRFRPIL